MSKTVLIVDDDPAFLSTLSELLEEKGYVPMPVKDGKEAIAALDVHKKVIDGAIIDLALPEIGGFQVIGELSKMGGSSPIPLLAVTGAYKDMYLEVAEYLGAWASVRKPAPGQPLTAIVDAFTGLIDREPRVESQRARQ